MDNVAIIPKLSNIFAVVRQAPILTAMLFFASGLLFFDRFDLPFALVAAAAFGGGVFAAVRSRSRAGRAALAISLFMFGGVAWHFHRLPVQQLEGGVVLCEIEIADEPAERRSGLTEVPARVVSIDGERPDHRVMVLLFGDSSLSLRFGDLVTVQGRLRTPRSDNNAYLRLLARRGYAGTLSASAADTLAVVHDFAAGSIHRAAHERFSRLQLGDDAAAVAGVMGAGDRSRMSASLREAYAVSGVAHILAVSGLHIGIIFLAANLLLRFLVILPHGEALSRAAVLVPVWLYAAACGFSPSVIRAAAMFSVLQLALAVSSDYISLNALAAAAMVMAALDPDVIFDISFQLSFAAVGSIILVGLPLFRFAHADRRIADRMWQTMVIGIVAFAASAPLVAHFFGRLSVAGAIVSPVAVLCAFVIVIATVLWTAVPAEPLRPVIEWLVDGASMVQNRVVESVAGSPWTWFDVELAWWHLALFYGLFGAAVVFFASVSVRYAPRRESWSPATAAAELIEKAKKTE